MTPDLQNDLKALLARFGPSRTSRLLGVSLSCMRHWREQPNRSPRPAAAARIRALAAEVAEGHAPITYGRLLSEAGGLSFSRLLAKVAPGLMPARLTSDTWVPRAAIRRLADLAGDGGLRLTLELLLREGETDA